MRHYRWWRGWPALVAVLGLLTTPMAASAATTSVGQGSSPGSTQATTTAFRLTPAEQSALTNAYQSNPHMSPSDAMRVIKSADAGPIARPGAIPNGYSSNSGTCSFIELWGYSNGYYHFHQDIYINPATVGTITISTNGIAPDVHYWGVSGWTQDGIGNLSFVGFGATGTTLSGWEVLDDGTFCSGGLVAFWP